MSFRRILSASLLFAGAAAAQCQESSGIFAGTQVVVSTDSATPSFDGGKVYFKPVGFHSVLLTGWPAAAAPNFALETAFRACGANANDLPDVDAMSLGMDLVLANNLTGRVSVPANRWGALTFSVTRKSKGKAGSTILGESTTADGASADIFSWVLPGSAVPAELIGRTQRAQDSREIDLGGGGSVLREVDALDHMIALYQLEPGLVNGLLPPDPTVYFSVSTATLSKVPTTWWGGSPPSGGTILQMTWDPRGRRWSCPRPFMIYKDLTLNQDEELDALALDIGESRMLFSTKTTTRNPILFSYFGALAAAAAVPYTTADGSKTVSEEIGLILPEDDIDAICALDPVIRASNFVNPLFFTVGTPRPRTLPGGLRLNASVMRDYSVGKGPMLKTHMTGWPGGGRAAGFAMLFLTPPDSFDPLIFIEMQARNTASRFCGDPRDAELQIPEPLSLSGLPINLRWFAFDATMTNLAEAHPQLIRL